MRTDKGHMTLLASDVQGISQVGEEVKKDDHICSVKCGMITEVHNEYGYE